jgi:Mce-associated membrane protein
MKSRLAALRLRMSWQVGLVAVLTVALLALAGERALAWQTERQRAADEKEAVAAASAEIEDLIDISDSTSQQDVTKLLDGATAGFRNEFEAQATRLRKALRKNKVTATGEVISAGVVRLDDDHATVIVAAAGTVANKSATDAQPRNYRLRVDLQQVGDRWLVSGLEFVA